MRNKYRLFFIAMVFMFLSPRSYAGSVLCTEQTSRLLVSEFKASQEKYAQIIPRFSRVPFGGVTEFGIDQKYSDDIVNFRIVSVIGPVSPSLSDDDISITEHTSALATSAQGNHLLVKAQRIHAGDIILDVEPILPSSVKFPSLTWNTRPGSLFIVACNKSDEVVFISQIKAEFSIDWTSLLSTIGITVLAYAAVAGAVWRREKKLRPVGRQLAFISYLDPVVLSSGRDSRGSVSRLQILFFSVILFYIFLYMIFRLEFLSNISNSVLLLLGISAVGAAASKATDISKSRLDFENWAWFINKRWLPENGLASRNVASWSDLVTGEDGFDVYHFQMLIFSVVVGIALLQSSYTDLQNFDIPNELLALLGLSQAVYVGGKVVASPDYGDLNDSTSKLRALEMSWSQEVIKKLSAGAPVPNFEEAKVLARLEYDEFERQQNLVKTMFTSTIGPLEPNANMRPEGY